jgi:hypothetical protein
VADGNTKAKGLLQLELDGAPDLVEHLEDVFAGAEQGGELSGLCKTSQHRRLEEKEKHNKRGETRGIRTLLRPGPKIRGICLIKVPDARKLSYFLANFLISFLFLLNFFKSSMVILSTPI